MCNDEPPHVIAGEDLRAIPKEELVDLILELQKFLLTQQRTLEEIVEERDAALMLNELCHY